MLEHVSTSLRLRAERTGKLPDGRREVSATLEPAALKISLYRRGPPVVAEGDDPGRSFLYGGMGVRYGINVVIVVVVVRGRVRVKDELLG